MKSSQTRVFSIDGNRYCFNCQAFRTLINLQAKKRNLAKGALTDSLSKKLHVSADAINKWKSGTNGPADIETIRSIGAYFHVDWKHLLKNADGGNSMAQLTERQKDAAKRVYDVLIWFLEEFSNTEGFNSWWLEFKEKGSAAPEDDIYERITGMEDRVRLVLNQEYFDLHDHEIYDALCEFVGEDLVDVYNGKISYAYRFEATAEDNPTVWDDYEKAMNKLNEIIERFI